MPISICLHVHLNTEACEIQDILDGLSFSEICFKDSGPCSDQCSDTVVLNLSVAKPYGEMGNAVHRANKGLCWPS